MTRNISVWSICDQNMVGLLSVCEVWQEYADELWFVNRLDQSDIVWLRGKELSNLRHKEDTVSCSKVIGDWNNVFWIDEMLGSIIAKTNLWGYKLLSLKLLAKLRFSLYLVPHCRVAALLEAIEPAGQNFVMTCNRCERIVFWGPNTNIIRVCKFDRIRIRILFVFL